MIANAAGGEMMSIEEAIYQLEGLITDICTGTYIQLDENDVEAIRIAMEALEEKAGY